MADPICSAVSLALGEPLQATASQVRNWLLVEHPGAWGPAALSQSGLPDTVSAGLSRLARRHGFRVLLVRRPERPSGPSRHCFVAHSGSGREWIEEGVVADVAQLLDVDFGPLGDGRPTGLGPLRAAPLYLVCTNGRHDPCCANLGRPVARALLRRGSESVWESSHFGGDRFAGNLVCLPHGLYFGRLSPQDAVRVADGYEQGILDLDHYRGRAGQPFAVQAAEFFVRRQAGLVGVEDLRATAHRPTADGTADVAFDGPEGRRFQVRVRIDAAVEPRLLSCGGAVDERPPTYALVHLYSR
jgi:hypothetical protein